MRTCKRVCCALAAVLVLAAVVMTFFLLRMPGDTIYAWQGNVAFFEQDGRLGLVDRLGNILLAPCLTGGGLFDEYGVAAVTYPGGCALLANTGSILHDAPGYHRILNSSNGQYQVYGYETDGTPIAYYVDARGQKIDEPVWIDPQGETLPEHIRRLPDGNLLAAQDGDYYICRADGVVLKQLTGYVRVYPTGSAEDGACLVAFASDSPDDWVMLTLSGELQATPPAGCTGWLDPQWPEMHAGMFRVNTPQGMGWLDGQGQLYTHPEWTHVDDFMGDVGTARLADGTLAFIGHDGKERFRTLAVESPYLNTCRQVNGRWYYRVACAATQQAVWLDDRGRMLYPPY